MSQVAQKDKYFDSLIGKEINESYRLESKLGVGAMGAVFKAINIKTTQLQAIKVISPELAADEKFIKRFEREGELGKLLNHPNIVRVKEFGKAGDLFFIAMEFIAGETLKSYLANTGALAPDRCLQFLTQLCNALDFAHQHKVLHRDLKPENILVARNSEGEEILKLADFGIAKRTDLSKTKDQMLTVEGEIFGTPHYMSPEQVLAQKLTPTTDVYSVGVMLYQMLSGKLPLEHPKAQQLLVMKVSQNIEPISKKHPFVSPLFDPIIGKVLSRAPSERYQTAGELLIAVSEVVGNLNNSSNRKSNKVEIKVESSPEAKVENKVLPNAANKRDSLKIAKPSFVEQKPSLSSSGKVKINTSNYQPSPSTNTIENKNEPKSKSNQSTLLIIIVVAIIILITIVGFLFFNIKQS